MGIARGIVILSLLGLLLQLMLAQDYKIVGSIPVGGTGHWDYLSVDSQNRRLYVSHNSEVVVVDVDSEKIVGKINVDGFSHGIALANDLNLGSESVRLFECDNALAVKFSIPQEIFQGDLGDGDPHRGQQLTPLVDIEVPSCVR